jgi:DNA-binding FadR family transcriptional regulator
MGGMTEEERQHGAVSCHASSRMSGMPVPELISMHAMVTRIACRRMTSPYLEILQDSVDYAASLSARFQWEHKAVAHAGIFRLLGVATGDPALAAASSAAGGRMHDLVLGTGPGADGLILNSRRRLMTCLRAGDEDGAAHETENHLSVLYFMLRLAGGPALASVERSDDG